MRRLSFDQFCEEKTTGQKRVFVLLMGDECPYLDSETHWFHHLPIQSFVVRLNVDDFHSLDIGRHPKTICTYNGNEIGAIDGFPDPETFAEYYRRILDEKK